jgi:hypothetical protein
MVAYRQQSVVLDAGARFGRHIPSKACGIVLKVLPDLARQATAMAFAQSPKPGRPGRWLATASDLRVLDISANADTGAATIRYEAPVLGSAAQDIFAQNVIQGMESEFPRPSPDDTALDLVADIFHDLHAKLADSSRLDPAVLDTIVKLRPALRGKLGYESLGFGNLRERPDARILNQGACEQASQWRLTTPEPRTVRIEGKLDMVWDSAGSFALLLDDNAFLPGAYCDLDPADVASLYRKRVTMTGKVFYRPNGRPLRFEPATVEPCLNACPVFAQIPEAIITHGRAITAGQTTGRNGLMDLVGMLDDPDVDDEAFSRMVKAIA